jgi:hypothetical protein
MDILEFILVAQAITILLILGLYFDIYWVKNGTK